ncbi:hypothetical protein L7F22_044919 [Adiantum nelumboides]|nr:hypothetical protein [Adiantum nelumboides]
MQSATLLSKLIVRGLYPGEEPWKQFVIHGLSRCVPSSGCMDAAGPWRPSVRYIFTTQSRLCTQHLSPFMYSIFRVWLTMWRGLIRHVPSCREEIERQPLIWNDHARDEHGRQLGERTHIDWARWASRPAFSFAVWAESSYVDTKIMAMDSGIRRGIPARMVEHDAAIPDDAAGFDRSWGDTSSCGLVLMRRAKASLEMRKLTNALIDLQEALEFDPTNEEALSLKRNVEDAIKKQCSSNVALPDGRRLAIEEIDSTGMEVRKQKNLHEKEEQEDSQLLADQWHTKGNNFFAEKNFREACDCYAKSLTFDPYSLRALCNKSLCELKLENYRAAEVDTSKALVIDSHCIKAFHHRGLARRALGKLTDALEDLQPCVIPTLRILRKCQHNFFDQVRERAMQGMSVATIPGHPFSGAVEQLQR